MEALERIASFWHDGDIDFSLLLDGSRTSASSVRSMSPTGSSRPAALVHRRRHARARAIHRNMVRRLDRGSGVLQVGCLQGCPDADPAPFAGLFAAGIRYIVLAVNK
jgi:hypothetical protein